MLLSAWSILCESAPFILAGFFIAGLLDALLSARRLAGWLGESGTRSVIRATLVGAPLPLCSCSVLPAAVTMRKKGASRGATLSFLVSTPETSVTSLLLTYALLGPALAVIRPIAALVTAITAGLVENFVEARCAEKPGAVGDGPASEDGQSDEDAAAAPDATLPLGARLRAGMHNAFVSLFDDIFIWVLLGILVAAGIQAWLPPELLNRILGGELRSMLVMVLIAVPLYVCNEASTPIAAVFMLQGVSPGAALVFLLCGPATNIGSLGVLYRLLGRRAVIVYLASIIIVSVLGGLAVNMLLSRPEIGLQPRVLDEPLTPAWIKVVGALVFLALGVMTIRRARYATRLAAWLEARLPVPVSPGVVHIAMWLLVIGGYFCSGFGIVRAGEIGIQQRFGKIIRADLSPGLHYTLPYPIDTLDRVAVQLVRRTIVGIEYDESGAVVDTDPREAWILIGDENIADIQAAIHWGARADQLTLFEYGVTDREQLVRDVVQAAMREVLSGASIETLFTASRRQHESQVEQLTQSRLDAYQSGIRVHAFHILYAHSPPDVHEAFRDVASALEDRATQVNQARAQEAQLIPLARGEADWMLREAEAYAALTVSRARGDAERFTALQRVYHEWPHVTAKRLEYETIEKVLPDIRKYLIPPRPASDEIEIWFLDDAARKRTPLWAPEDQ